MLLMRSSSLGSRGRERAGSQETWDVVLKKKRMQQRNRWSIIFDSFLLTEAISYKMTHSMADRTRGVI